MILSGKWVEDRTKKSPVARNSRRLADHLVERHSLFRRCSKDKGDVKSTERTEETSKVGESRSTERITRSATQGRGLGILGAR